MKAHGAVGLLIATLIMEFHPGETMSIELSSYHAPSRAFTVYDNMFYRGKPDTAKDGLMAANIIYEDRIWQDRKKPDSLPKRDEFVRLIRASVANPGPLVIDIESLPHSGNQHTGHAHMEVLATLAVWAHEAAPHKQIGFYGTHTLTDVKEPYLLDARELARHVDAFFPPAYTFDDDQAKWRQRAEEQLVEARRLDPAKPVYFYLWPQYHGGTPKAFAYLSAEYWKFQLEATYRRANGVVLWGPSRFEWNDDTGWWSETTAFMRKSAAMEIEGLSYTINCAAD